MRTNETAGTTGSAREPDPVPRGRARSGSDTRRKLIDTAERLIAERGLQAVSVRDITGTADANSAAIHYHFQSKEGLVLAVLADRAEALQERRSAHLDNLDADFSVRDLARAMVLPTIELTGGDEPSGAATYVGFLAALLEEPGMIGPIEATLRRPVRPLRRRAPRRVPRTTRATWPATVLRSPPSWCSTRPHPSHVVSASGSRHTTPSTAATLADDLVDFLAGALGAPSGADGGVDPQAS